MARKTDATYQVLESLLSKLAGCAEFKDRDFPHVYPVRDPYDELVFDLTPEEAKALRQVGGKTPAKMWIYEGAFMMWGTAG